jgi:hypothetical protein
MAKELSLKKRLLREKQEEICRECNDDIKDIQLYLKYKYNPDKNELSNIKKEFKQIINDKCRQTTNKDYINELITKLKGENNEI